MTDYDLILGLKTKPCVNGITPETIPTIEGNIEDMNTTLEELGTTVEGVADDVGDNTTAIGGLDTRVTALENTTPTTLEWTFKPYAEWDELFESDLGWYKAKHSIRIIEYNKSSSGLLGYGVLRITKGEYLNYNYNYYIRSSSSNTTLRFAGYLGSFIINTSVSDLENGIKFIIIADDGTISVNRYTLSKSNDLSSVGRSYIAIQYLDD